jgi:hypothetical protein
MSHFSVVNVRSGLGIDGQRAAYAGGVKILDGLHAIEPGSLVPVTELGLPVSGAKGLLLVFWKST